MKKSVGVVDLFCCAKEIAMELGVYYDTPLAYSFSPAKVTLAWYVFLHAC